jgi:pantothenate kinase
VELAERGDRRNLDLLVKDTAGSGYNLMPSDGMVSSFGKAAKQNTTNPGNTE